MTTAVVREADVFLYDTTNDDTYPLTCTSTWDSLLVVKEGRLVTLSGYLKFAVESYSSSGKLIVQLDDNWSEYLMPDTSLNSSTFTYVAYGLAHIDGCGYDNIVCRLDSTESSSGSFNPTCYIDFVAVNNSGNSHTILITDLEAGEDNSIRMFLSYIEDAV